MPSVIRKLRLLTPLCVLVLTCVTAPALAQLPTEGAVDSPPPAESGVSEDQAVKIGLDIIDKLEKPNPLEDDAKKANDYNLASQYLNFVMVKKPDPADPLHVKANYGLARLSILSGRPLDAMAGIEEYANNRMVGGNDWYAHKLLGDLRVTSYPQLAKPEYQKAVVLAPTEAEAYYGLAKAFKEMNQAADAVENARKAIQFDKEGKPEYRKLLAEAHGKAKDQQVEAAAAAKQGVALIEEQIRKRPGDVILLARAREHYELLGKCLTELSRQYPENDTYALEQIHTFEDKADLERLLAYHAALKALEEARKSPLAKKSADLMYEEARLDQIVGRTTRAVDVLEENLQTFPDHKPSQDLLQALKKLVPPPPPEEAAGGPPRESAVPSPGPVVPSPAPAAAPAAAANAPAEGARAPVTP